MSFRPGYMVLTIVIGWAALFTAVLLTTSVAGAGPGVAPTPSGTSPLPARPAPQPAQPDATHPEAMRSPATDTGPAQEANTQKPLKVVTGVFINDIHELDFRTHSYAVDFYVWFRWADPSVNPSKSMEFMNRVAPADHQRDELLETPSLMPDGSRYAVIRQQGRFATKLDLRDFPYDQQTLRIVFEDSMASSPNQIYAPDDVPVTINADVSLPGFSIGSPKIRLVENSYPTNFGDLQVQDMDSYSRAIVEIPVTRPLLTVTIKTFLPLLLVVMCALLVFFINPVHVEGRIGLGITALLTLVALQLTATSALPEVDYLMLIDKAYLASYAFIISSLARVVFTSWIREDDHIGVQRIKRLDRVWAAILTMLYLAALALTALPTLFQQL